MARSALLNVMVQAALKAGKSLGRDFGEVQNLQVSVKGPGDFVSTADRKAEKIVREELLKARPTYGFLGEESEEIKGTDGAHRWIVDPLDGTTNFLHGIPAFAVSIALERNGEIVAAVVFNPATDELYTAERGGGAFLNDRRLRVAARRALSDCVIGCGVLGARQAQSRQVPGRASPRDGRSGGHPPSGFADARSCLCRCRAVRRFLGSGACAVGHGCLSILLIREAERFRHRLGRWRNDAGERRDRRLSNEIIHKALIEVVKRPVPAK